MSQQIQNRQSLGSLRISDEDVRAVIDLWVDHQWGSDRATVSDLAEGLDLSVEEVHTLLEEVYARRTRVEIDVVMERERLELEQRELAAEQARLAKTERRLSNYDRERTHLRQVRLKTRRRRLSLEYGPSPKPLKSTGEARGNSGVPAGPASVTRRRSVLDTANTVTGLLLMVALATTALWHIVSAVLHALAH